MPFFSARPTSTFNVRSRRRGTLPFLTRQIITTGYTATDSGVELGASGQPTGTASGTGATGTCCPSGLIGGRSSGHGYWRD
jgi:hypothetical protein